MILDDFDGFLKQHIRWDKDDFSKAESTYFEANRQKLYEEARQITNKEEINSLKFSKKKTENDLTKKSFVQSILQSVKQKMYNNKRTTKF